MTLQRLVSLLLFAALPLWSGCGGGGGGSAATGVPVAPDVISPAPEPEPEPQPDLEPQPDPAPDPEPDSSLPAQEVMLEWGNEDSQQFGVLYLPEVTNQPLPVVVMVHGGCWLSFFSLEFTSELSAALASQGFAVWNIEYRRLGSGGEWPVIFRDVAAAVDFLPSIAADYNLDLNAVSAMGHSAGGHLALWLAGRQGIMPGRPLYQADPLAIRGVVALGPVTDLEATICGRNIPDLIDSNALTGIDLEARLRVTSPRVMLPIGVATIVVSGSEDGIAPPDFSQAYVDAAVSAGDVSEHLVIDGAGHFELVDPDFIDVALLINSLQQVRARTPEPDSQ